MTISHPVICFNYVSKMCNVYLFTHLQIANNSTSVRPSFFGGLFGVFPVLIPPRFFFLHHTDDIPHTGQPQRHQCASSSSWFHMCSTNTVKSVYLVLYSDLTEFSAGVASGGGGERQYHD